MSFAWGGVSLVLALGGCGGLGSHNADRPADSAVGASMDLEDNRPAVRRLSSTEIGRAVTDVLGPIDGLDSLLPPDSREHLFSRVAQSQSVSAYEVESWGSVAALAAASVTSSSEHAATALGCEADAFPPITRPTAETTSGDQLVAEPSWTARLEGSEMVVYYSEHTTLSTTIAVPEEGRYRFELTGRVDESASDTVEMALWVDGAMLGTTSLAGPDDQTVAIEADLTAGTHILTWQVLTDLYQVATLYISSVGFSGPLDVATQTEIEARSACADDWIERFATRAWRRPLEPEDLSALALLMEAGTDSGYFYDGVSLVIQAVLQSPRFLYWVEVGTPVEGRPGWYALDGYELAARLSSLAWGTIPDEELLRAAAAGELETEQGLEDQARRVFLDPRARVQVLDFDREWLDLDLVASLTRDVELFPEFTEQVRAAMTLETETFLDQMFWEGGRLSDLMAGRERWVPAELAPIYGIEGSQASETVTLPEARAGILTHPSILAITSHAYETSPIVRGIYVLERFLCTELPPPPSTVDITVPPFDETLSTRERYAAHTSDAACQSCHTSIDPVGFLLEEFDPIGRVRTSDNGEPVDASGGIPTLGIDDGALWGGAELGATLAERLETRQCVARLWLRFGLGRVEGTSDIPSIDDVATTLESGSLEEAFVSLTATEAFRHRIVPDELEGE